MKGASISKVLQVAFPRQCNDATVGLIVQLLMQQVCNMDIKNIATQTLKRVKNATKRATALQKDCCKVVAQGNKIATPVATSKVTSWKEDEKLLIDGFLESNNLPKAPFQLKPAVQVIDTRKFYQGLYMDIERGNMKERSIFGAFQDDLRCLKKIIEDKKK